MITSVYHRKIPKTEDLDPMIRNGVIPFCPVPLGLIKPEDYELVATMDSDVRKDLLVSQAFFLTNSIEDNWFEHPNPCIKPVEGMHRSTTAGDIIVYENKAFHLGWMGWDDVSPLFFPKPTPEPAKES